MSLLCSVKLKRRKDGPLTTDSCQLDDMLALGRPMSNDGGDKRLANQFAYKITALPSTAHEVTACAVFNYPALREGEGSMHGLLTPVILVLLQKLWSIEYIPQKSDQRRLESKNRKKIPIA